MPENENRSRPTTAHASHSGQPNIRGKKADDYSLRIVREKCNVVQVFEKADGRKRLCWQFKLDRNTKPIVFQSFIDDSRFMIMDWEGSIWCYDIVQKNEVYHKDFHASLRSYALLAGDRRHLYLSLEPHRQPRTVYLMELDFFKTLEEIELKNQVGCYGLWQNGDGRLVHYFHDRDFATNTSSHGFVTIDLTSKKEEKFALSNPPHSFDEKMPWLDIQNAIGVRSYYDVEVKKVGKEERFLSRVAIFDLRTFADTAILVAREYTADQLGYSMESGTADPSAEALRIAAAEKRPSDDVDAFVNDINSIHFTKDGHFWICYRGGILRKIAVNGSRMSTFVVGNPPMAFPPEGGLSPFMNKYFHSYIERIDEPEIILKEHERFLRLMLPEMDLFATAEVVQVDLQEFNPDADLVVSKKEARDRDEIGLQIVQTKSTADRAGLLGALQAISRLTKDIESIRSGDTLAFLVKDEKKSLNEKKFFKRVAEFPEARPFLREILNNFVSFPDAGALYMDSETTALAHAAWALATSDPNGIESYMDYLCVIDMEHDVINREQIIPALLKQWKNTAAAFRLRTSLIMADDSEMRDDSFFRELRKKKEFFDWFTELENQKMTARWMAGCARREIGISVSDVIELLQDGGLADFVSVLRSEL